MFPADLADLRRIKKSSVPICVICGKNNLDFIFKYVTFETTHKYT